MSEPLSEYEQARQENIRRNKEQLEALGLARSRALADDTGAKPVARRARARPRSPEPPRPQRVTRARRAEAGPRGSGGLDADDDAAPSPPLGPEPRAHLQNAPPGRTLPTTASGGDSGCGLKRAIWNGREPDPAAGEVPRPRKTTEIFDQLFEELSPAERRKERLTLNVALSDMLGSDGTPDGSAAPPGPPVLRAGDVLTVCIPGVGDVASAELSADGSLTTHRDAPASVAGRRFETLNSFVSTVVKTRTATKFNAWLHTFRGGTVLDALRERWLRRKYGVPDDGSLGSEGVSGGALAS